MRSRNEIVGIKHVTAKKTGKRWTILYFDISDKDTEGVAVASVWTDCQHGEVYNIGDIIEVLCVNGRYFIL